METKKLDTKICPKCRKEIDILATRCPYCQSNIRPKTRTWAWVLVGIILFIAFLGALSSGNSGSVTPSTSSDSSTNLAYSISSATGESEGDVASALAVVEQTYKNPADVQQIITAMAQEASITNTTTLSNAQILVPLFDNWHESVSNISQDVADINGGVKLGKISFDDLTTALTEAGVAMSGTGLTVGTAAVQLEEVTTVGTLTSADVVNIFEALASAIENPDSKLNILLGGYGKVASDIKQGGIPAAFQDLATHIQAANQ